MALFLTLLTFFSTLFGGLFGLFHREKLHGIMGFIAGVLIAVVAFEVLPEIIRLEVALPENTDYPMIALIAGFLLFHIAEKLMLIHQQHTSHVYEHHHPSVGLLSALVLSVHSFLDGVGIALGFHVSSTTGILVALAVIGHDFSDGLNTVSLMLINKNTSARSFVLLLLDAVAPVLGVIFTGLIKIPNTWLILYLGFFAGFLLYIGASEILPEAHSQTSKISTIILTLIGVVLVYLISRI